MLRIVWSIGIASATCIGVARAYVEPNGEKPSLLAPSVTQVESRSQKPASSGEDAMVQHEGVTAGPSPFSPIVFGVVFGLCAAVLVGSSQTVLAEDINNGMVVFKENCSPCHLGGYNSVKPDKKLQKDALVRYKRYQIVDIVDQVTNGNGAMPAFGGLLKEKDIKDVAAFVRGEADKAANIISNNKDNAQSFLPGGRNNSKPKPNAAADILGGIFPQTEATRPIPRDPKIGKITQPPPLAMT